MAEFRRATGPPVATNMIATNWREMGHAGDAQRRRYPAGGPALLDALRRGAGWRSCATTGGSPRAAIPTTTLIFPWRCLPTSAPPRRATPTAIDTHWIWQEGDARLTKNPLQIINGSIAVQTRRDSAWNWTGSRCAEPMRPISAAGRRAQRRRPDAVPDPRLEHSTANVPFSAATN